MRYYIFLYSLLLIILLIILFLLINYGKIKRVLEKQGLADINSEYIYPEIIPRIITEKQNREILEYASKRFSPSVGGGGLKNVVDGEVRRSQTAWIPKEEPIIIIMKPKIIIDYYFTLSKEGHPLTWLFNNFDKLKDTVNANEVDKKLRAERRAELAKLREEWLNGNA